MLPLEQTTHLENDDSWINPRPLHPPGRTRVCAVTVEDPCAGIGVTMGLVSALQLVDVIGAEAK